MQPKPVRYNSSGALHSLGRTEAKENGIAGQKDEKTPKVIFAEAAAQEHYSKSSSSLQNKRVSVEGVPRLKIGELSKTEKERASSNPQRPLSAGRMRDDESVSPKQSKRNSGVLKNIGHIVFSKESDAPACSEPSPSTPSRRRGSSPRNENKIEHGKAKSDDFFLQPACLRLKSALDSVKIVTSPRIPDAALASSNSSLSSDSRASSSTDPGLKATWSKVVKNWEAASARLQALNLELDKIFHSSDANEKNQKWLTSMSMTVKRLLEVGNPLLKENCKLESMIAFTALKDLNKILQDVDRHNKLYKDFIFKSFGSEDSYKEWIEGSAAIREKLQLSKDSRELPKKEMIFAQNHFWIEKPKASPQEDRRTLNEITTDTAVRCFKMADGRPLIRTLTVRNGSEAKNEKTVFVGSDFPDPKKGVCTQETQINYYTEFFTRLFDKGYRGVQSTLMPINEQAARTVTLEPFDFDRVLKWCSHSSFSKANEYLRALYPTLFDKFLTNFDGKESNCDCDIHILGPKSCAVSLCKSYKVFRPLYSSEGYKIEGVRLCEIRVKWTLYDEPENYPRQIGLLKIDAINFSDEATADERQAILEAMIKHSKEIQLASGNIPGDMMMKSDRFQQILK